MVICGTIIHRVAEKVNHFYFYVNLATWTTFHIFSLFIHIKDRRRQLELKLSSLLKSFIHISENNMLRVMQYFKCLKYGYLKWAYADDVLF